jgi:hypothetical protein
MLQKANLGSFQYMVDLGVPQEDVAWLRRVANTPGARQTQVAARIRRIQDQAYDYLIAASTPAHQPACQ